jgi:hypothetical protein
MTAALILDAGTATTPSRFRVEGAALKATLAASLLVFVTPDAGEMEIER